MLKGFFSQKKEIELVAPIQGELIPIDKVKDTMFSQKVLGEGFAMVPNEKIVTVVSPITGKINNVFPTKHAIGLIGPRNIEILYHFGLDTVSLKGKGIQCHISEGQKIKKGEKMLTIDLLEYEAAGIDVVNMLVFTNEVDVSEILEKLEYRKYQRGEAL